MSKFKITTTDGLSFDISGEAIDKLDIIKNADGSYNLIYHDKSYNVEVLEADYLNKRYVLNINDKEISLSLKNELDLAIEKMGFSKKSSISGGKILSPMPGLVIKMNKKEGDSVQKGDNLLILEAMKMENIIKAPSDGKVKKIHVSEGSTVAKKELLLEID